MVKRFKGNWQVFNNQNKNKPIILKIIEIIDDKYAFVFTKDKPDDIMKWALEAEQLQKTIPHIKRILSNNKSTFFKVVYKGKNKKKETFEIKQYAMNEWYPIEYDLLHITKQQEGYAIHSPAFLKQSDISAGTTIETAIRYRDFYRQNYYSNMPKKPVKCCAGIPLKLEKYAKNHKHFTIKEIQDILFSNNKNTIRRQLNKDVVQAIEEKGVTVEEVLKRIASEL